MKIAVWYNLPSGGAKRALYEMVKRLQARGHSLEAWGPPFIDQSYLPLAALIPEHILPSRLVTFTPPVVYGLKTLVNAYQHTQDKIKALDEHSRACAQAINARDFDVLFSHNDKFLGVGAIGQYANLPRVLYTQEPFRFLYEASPVSPWVAPRFPERFWTSPRQLKRYLSDISNAQSWRVQARAERENALAFDLRLCNSYFSRESIVRAYGLDARVSYLGIDTDLFFPTGCAREPFVLGVSSVTAGKGLERAVRGVGAIPSAHRPPLVWIGNSANEHYQTTMLQLAAELQVDLHFHVGVPDEELRDWLNRATVLVYTPYLEPFGMTPLEANACETPVVTIAEGGIRETVHHEYNGLVLNDADPRALAESLLRVLDDPALARRLGQTGRANVLQNWTWDAAIDRLESHLHSARP